MQTKSFLKTLGLVWYHGGFTLEDSIKGGYSILENKHPILIEEDKDKVMVGALFAEAGFLKVVDPILFFNKVGLAGIADDESKRYLYTGAHLYVHHQKNEDQLQLIVLQTGDGREEDETADSFNRVIKQVYPAYFVKEKFHKEQAENKLEEKIWALEEKIEAALRESVFTKLLAKELPKKVIEDMKELEKRSQHQL